MASGLYSLDNNNNIIIMVQALTRVYRTESESSKTHVASLDNNNNIITMVHALVWI